jgi:hypothetical protein
MMKTMSISSLTLFALLAFGMFSDANASDWTIPANPACEVSLGNVANTSSGYRASGGTAVISCDLTKKVGSNNLNWVYARINRNLSGGANPFCTLNSYSAYGSSDTTFGSASTGAGNKSISLPLPTIYSTGYLNVVCVLNNNDTLYGIRYGQDD